MTTLLKVMSIDERKIDRLLKLLDVVDYDPDTKTLTVNSDINIKVKGDYRMDSDRHLRMNSNYIEIDPELGIPFSLFWNSDEAEFRKIQKQANDILSDDIDCGCGNH